MRKQLSLVIGVQMLAVLAGCGKKPEPPPTGPPPAGPGAAAVQVAKNAGPDLPCNPKRDEVADPNRVTAGTYCVCDVGPPGQMIHPTTNVKGEHMGNNNPVIIGTLSDTTSVTLGQNNLKFQRTEGGLGLSALVAYSHVDAAQNEEQVTHLVNITKYKPPVGGEALGTCDVINKNVITVTYCYWAGATDVQDWKCATTVGGHLGDVHAQN